MTDRPKPNFGGAYTAPEENTDDRVLRIKKLQDSHMKGGMSAPFAYCCAVWEIEAQDADAAARNNAAAFCEATQ